MARVTMGYVIAAIRECYEEAGVLLATDADGAHDQRRSPGARTSPGGLRRRRRPARTVRRAPTAALPSTIWCGSAIGSRRSRNRLVASTPVSSSPLAPPAQTSKHDDNETIASAWVRPSDALRRQADGELAMMPPTIKNLEFVGAHADAESAMQSARATGRSRPRSCRECAGTPTDESAVCRCRPTTTTRIWVRRTWADRPRPAQPQPATTSAPSTRPC